MTLLVWTANHALWVSLFGALCSVAVRFERLLPRRLHRLILFVSLFVTFATPLLGLLKKSLDDRWKTQMQEQVAVALKASQPKPLKDRVVDFLNRLDPKIIPAIRSGQTDFGGSLTYAQLGELQSLAHEDSGSVFIIYLPSTNLIMNQPGKVGDQRFRVLPSILK